MGMLLQCFYTGKSPLLKALQINVSRNYVSTFVSKSLRFKIGFRPEEYKKKVSEYVRKYASEEALRQNGGDGGVSSSSESSMSDYSEDEAQVNMIIPCTLIYSMIGRQLAPFKNVNISFFSFRIWSCNNKHQSPHATGVPF